MSSFISSPPSRDRRPGCPRPAREQAVVLGAFQRERLLGAALQEVSQRGCARTSVAHIVARARVSRKTFYEIFDSRDGCLAVMFEEAVAQLAGVAAPAYASEGTWAERVRCALAALLASLESERELGAFVLGRIAGEDSIHPALRARVLGRLRAVVEDAPRREGSAEPSPLAGEVVVGGVLAVVHAHLQKRTRRLGDLLNPLMWTIVLPYLGPAAAARELHHGPPRPATARSRPSRGALDGLDIRVTYRTASVLAAIAEQPGASNVEIAARAQVSDQGQISKLLARLAGLGLAENTGAYSTGAAKAWHLTPRGHEVSAALSHRFLPAAPAAGRRHDA